MSNIEAKPTKTKGNGGNIKLPHHNRITQTGQPPKRLLDGCRKNSTCEGCDVPVSECNPNYL